MAIFEKRLIKNAGKNILRGLSLCPMMRFWRTDFRRLIVGHCKLHEAEVSRLVGAGAPPRQILAIWRRGRGISSVPVGGISTPRALNLALKVLNLITRVLNLVPGTQYPVLNLKKPNRKFPRSKIPDSGLSRARASYCVLAWTDGVNFYQHTFSMRERATVRLLNLVL